MLTYCKSSELEGMVGPSIPLQSVFSSIPDKSSAASAHTRPELGATSEAAYYMSHNAQFLH